jgi:hypothetical protein
MRVMCAFVLVVGLAMPAQAQEAERGWFFSGSFNGSPGWRVRTISGQDSRKDAETTENEAKAHIKTKPLS